MAVIADDIAERLRESFKALRQPVRLEVYTAAGQNEEFSEFTREFVSELTKLTDKITAGFFRVDSPEAKAKGIERSPTVLIAPDRYQLRIVGAPAGEEARSFLQAIFMASAGMSRLSEASRRRLEGLRERRRIKVFVTPT